MKKIKNNTVKKKSSYWIVLGGIIIIAISIFLANWINSHREVRNKGQLIKCPIVEIRYANKGGNSGSVQIEGQVFDVYSLDSHLNLGDSILVRYDKEKSIVIQEKYTMNNFLVFFALDSVLLVIGLGLIFAGITGKGR